MTFQTEFSGGADPPLQRGTWFHATLIIQAMGKVLTPFPEHESRDYLLNNSFLGKMVTRLREEDHRIVKLIV